MVVLQREVVARKGLGVLQGPGNAPFVDLGVGYMPVLCENA